MKITRDMVKCSVRIIEVINFSVQLVNCYQNNGSVRTPNYSDSDSAGSYYDRKSTSAYVFCLASKAISCSFKSKTMLHYLRQRLNIHVNE
jgi:hypothetical protein